jgi:hypothetical protein
MRNLWITLGLALAVALAGCGNSSDAAKASGQSRLYDTQRDVLEKAKAVNDTMLKAEQAQRGKEEKEAQ